MIKSHHIAALSLLAALTSCSSTSKTDRKGPAPAPVASPVPSPSPSPSASPKAESTAGSLEVICEQSGDKRSISVVPAQQGCEVHYLKSGKAEVVATGTSGSAHCDQVQSKIRKNLETAGYTCR